MDNLNHIESLPGFAKLSYEDQVQTRMIFFQELFQKEEFKQLKKEQQNMIMEKLLYRPPKFEDKALEKQVNDLVKGIHQGDRKAIQTGTNILLQDAYTSNSVLASLLSEKLINPILNKIAPAEETKTLRPWQVLGRDEERKAISALELGISADKRLAKTLNTTRKVTGTFTNIAEIVGMGIMTSGTWAWPTGAAKGIASMGGGLAKAASKPALQALMRTSQVLTHGAIEGASGVVRENLKGILNESYEENPQFRDVVERSGRYFKDYFLWDVLFNFGLGVAVPALRGSLSPFLPQTKGGGWNLTKDNFKKVLNGAVYGEDLPEKLVQQLDPSSQAWVRTLQATGRTHQRVPRLDYEDVIEMVGGKEGFATMPRADGTLDVYSSLSKKPIAHVKNFQEYEQFLVKQQEALPTMAGESAPYAAAERRLLSREIIRGTVKTDTLPAEALSNMIAPVGGKFKAENIRDFGRILIKDAGLEDDLARTFKVKKLSGGFGAYLDNKRVAFFKSNVISEADEVRPIKQLVDAIESRGQGGKVSGAQFQKIKEGLKGYQKNLAESYSQTPAWANYVLKEKLNLQLGDVKKGFKVIDAQGQTKMSFDDFTDLRKWIIKKTMTPADLKDYLHRFEGLYLRQTKAGEFILERKHPGTSDLGYTTREYGRASSFEELVDTYDELFEKLPSDLGPKLGLIDKDKVRVEYHRGSALGTQQTLLEHFNGFYEKPLNKLKVFLKSDSSGTITLEKGTGRKSLEVFNETIGDRRYFDSYKEALEWFKRSSFDYDELKTVAAKKGYQLDRAGGKFVLYGEQGYRKYFATPQEVGSELAKVKMPAWAPELTGELQESLYRGYEKPPDGVFKPEKLYDDLQPKEGSYSPITRLYRPKDATFENIFKATGDDWFLNSYMDVETSLRTLDALSYHQQKLAEGIFRPGGKWIRPKQRREIFAWMSAKHQDALNGTEEAKKLFKEFGFGQKEITVEKQMREAFKELSEVFQIDYDDLIFNYLPKIKKAHQAKSLRGIPDGETAGLFDAVAEGHAPQRIKSFFRNQRVSEIIDTSFIDDPLEVMTRYAAVGYREKLLGGVWDRIKTEMAQKTKELDPEMFKAWGNYQDMVMGIKTANEKTMIENLNKVLKGFGVEAEASKTAVEYFMSLGYFASMGLRPWIVFRNTMQPWTTLAPRIGNHWVAEAMRKFNPVIRKQIETLKTTGFIKPYQVPVGGVELQAGQKADKLLQGMISLFRHSDDYTRAVAYGAHQLRYWDAVQKFSGFDPKTGKKLAKTIFTQDEFLEASGTNIFSKPVQKRALEHIQKGQWEAAGDFLSKQLSDETMFMYRAAGRPDMFKGVAGKVFGMFGTYPVHYLENIRRGLSHGSFASKALYAGTFLANTTMLYEGFKNLGVNAQNFLFWSPALFSGGPMYHMFNQALLATKDHYEGRQARAKLFGLTTKDGKVQFNPAQSELFKWAIPGSFMGQSIIKGIQALNEGDPYRAFLNFTSSPIDIEYFQDGPNAIGTAAADILYDLPVSTQFQIPNLPKLYTK